ncbi:MAG: ABC transporter substrate-binding protein [Ruminiclostridium sp.]
MKSSKRVIFMSMAVAMLLTTLVGCGTSKDNATTSSTVSASSAPTSTAAQDEKQEIRLMTSWTAGSAAYESIEALLKTYKTEKPNITIVHDALPSADLRTKLTVEMAAGTPADVSWCVLSYANEFIKDNKIIDWAPVYKDPRHPEFKEWFSDVSLNFASTEDGKIMMAPQEGSIDGLYYNTELFTKNGWKVPTTFDELLALVPQIKAKGISPIVTGGKDGRFAWLASALLARSAGLDNFKALTKGDAMKSWNDPKYGFVGAMEKFAALVDSGAYPKGVLGMSATEADQMFAKGEAAMYYEGAWKPGNFEQAGGKEFVAKLARVNFPVMTDSPNGDTKVNVGGNIIGFFVANGLSDSKTQASINLVKDICSPEFNVPIMEKGGFVYAGKADYDKSKVSAVMNQCIEAYRSATSYIPSMDGIAPPSIDLAIKQTAMPGIITKEFSVEKAVAEVQKAAEDYEKSK